MNIYDNPQIEILKEEMVMGIQHNNLLICLALAILVLVIIIGVVVTRVDDSHMDAIKTPLIVLNSILITCILVSIGLFFLDERPTGQTLYTVRTEPNFPWQNYEDDYIVVDVNKDHTMWLIQDNPLKIIEGESDGER